MSRCDGGLRQTLDRGLSGKPRHLTGEALAGRLGVSVRTIRRDLSDRQAAGVPIGIRSGVGCGYSIDSRRWLPTIVLTPGEAAALVAALTAVGPHASGHRPVRHEQAAGRTLCASNHQEGATG